MACCAVVVRQIEREIEGQGLQKRNAEQPLPKLFDQFEEALCRAVCQGFREQLLACRQQAYMRCSKAEAVHIFFMQGKTYLQLKRKQQQVDTAASVCRSFQDEQQSQLAAACLSVKS